VPAHAVEEVPAPFVRNLARRAGSSEVPSVGGVLADRRLLSPAAVVRLQRLAGNSSVSQLLARNERRAEPHRELTPHLVAQRDGDEPAPAAQTESSEAEVGQEISVPAITVDGNPGSDDGEGGCDNLSLHGNTHADFDGGPGSTVTNQKASISKGCDPACGPDVKCINLTGTLVSAYKATVQVNMPDMPGGLTECEQGKVQDFLDKVLLPHEKDHEKRLKTYDGKTQLPVNITGCGMDDLTSKVEKMHLDEDAKRQDAARKLSKAIDPFRRTVDCSGCKS
jgi:hypothetical protein